MKKTLSLISAILLIVFFNSCDEDWNPDELLKNPTGELSLSDMIIVSDNNTDIINDDFIIRILSGDSIIHQWKKAQTPATVILDKGSYNLDVVSHDPCNAEWDTPYYKGSKSFSIAENEITEITEIQCYMASAMVSVKYSDDVKTLISDDAIVTVTAQPSNILEFTKDETRIGHMLLPENSPTLSAKFTGTVDGEYVSVARAITDVAAGQLIEICYTYDDLVNIDPEKAPAITSQTLNLDGINTITDDIVAKVDISAPYGIEIFNVKIISEQLTPEMLQDVGLAAEFDLAHPGELAEALNELGFPTGDAVLGKTELAFDITAFMPLLAMFEGTHQFQLTITDKKGLTSSKTLTFEAKQLIDPEKAPAITSQTLNLDGVNTITDDIVAKVDISAPYGIEIFNVKIISEQLTPEMLQDVGLAAEFDLAHPGELAEALNELGFPTGDAVLGKTELAFDITAFMPLLAMFEGTHQFQLTITDKEGLTVTKTLTFQAI